MVVMLTIQVMYVQRHGSTHTCMHFIVVVGVSRL